MVKFSGRERGGWRGWRQSTLWTKKFYFWRLESWPSGRTSAKEFIRRNALTMLDDTPHGTKYYVMRKTLFYLGEDGKWVPRDEAGLAPSDFQCRNLVQLTLASTEARLPFWSHGLTGKKRRECFFHIISTKGQACWKFSQLFSAVCFCSADRRKSSQLFGALVAWMSLSKCESGANIASVQLVRWPLRCGNRSQSRHERPTTPR